MAYGNLKLLESSHLFCIPEALADREQTSKCDTYDRMTESAVLGGGVLISTFNTPSSQRCAIVPLRWGAPRILIASACITHALGEDLLNEPFRMARLWRYQWDAKTDLMLSLRDTGNTEAYDPRHQNFIKRLTGIHLTTDMDITSIQPLLENAVRHNFPLIPKKN